MNTSRVIRDSRPIETIIAEKAMAGAIPVNYSLLPHVRGGWQQVDWLRNPNLLSIEFSDGSVAQVATAGQMVESRRIIAENETGSAKGENADGMHPAHTEKVLTQLEADLSKE